MPDRDNRIVLLYTEYRAIKAELSRLRVIAECWAKVPPGQQARIWREIEDEAVD